MTKVKKYQIMENGEGFQHLASVLGDGCDGQFP